MSEGPLFAYRAKVRDGQLDGDPAQELAAEKLQSIWHALKGYSPGAAGGWKARFGLARRREEPPAGLYLYGGVGRGKSMLMDLFFAVAPVERKRRVHFHEFMLEVHDRLHARRTKGDRRVDDLLPDLAGELAQEAWLLCFDEFHVANIADAMILGRLFEGLFDAGVVVVATSNWAPGDLYEGGLQRELFLPFIDLINRRLDVLELEARRDYRLARLMTMKVYHTPVGRAADRALEKAFAELTGDARGEPCTLSVKKRDVEVPRQAKGVAWFGFSDLCERPLGAGDYLAIARRFHTIILSGIPRMTADQRNEAKRFATLIDTLYEHRATLVCSAEAAPQDLYRGGAHAFDFQRTASRLMEMQSTEYIERRAAA